MKGIKNGGRLTDRQVGFLLVVPGLAVFAAIILYPFVDAVLMSFTDRSLLYPDYDWVGLANYIKVFKDPYFVSTLATTALFVVLATVIPFVLGFIWAILLNQGFKGSELLRGLTLVNWIIPGIAIGFLWSWIFNGQYGVLNALLTNLGILDKGVAWMGQTQTALICVVIARTWQMLPWYMAFLLGGLQGVSRDQIEAARIDGAATGRPSPTWCCPRCAPS
ncbi:carbohydrate ABC transporter permease [Candidatus Allofournierella excrementigallinarum]|uniref:carbohydrate ABC transporter permease n=1 Tax=Candidatus Allofournierella excrementigallinarum TaxID=2838592 RepID=UPI00374EB142